MRPMNRVATDSDLYAASVQVAVLTSALTAWWCIQSAFAYAFDLAHANPCGAIRFGIREALTYEAPVLLLVAARASQRGPHRET